jgi:hypothetical protein
MRFKFASIAHACGNVAGARAGFWRGTSGVLVKAM